MTDYANADFFMDMSLVDDPYPYFDYLRGSGPVTRLPARNTFAVTGFDEAIAVHLDHHNFSSVNCVTGPLPAIPFTPEGDDITCQIEAHRAQMPFGEDVLTLDQPRHTPLRSLMMRLFTPRRLKEMEGEMASLSDRLLDEVEPSGCCELLRDYAKPFATLTIADLLGVPPEDREEFRAVLAEAAPTTQIGRADDARVINPMEFRRGKFLRYVAERRAAPQADIIGDLAAATFPDGSVPTALDVVRVATLLFGAGQDSTATLLANGLRIIAERPDIQSQLREDPARIPDFVEEVLRIAGPVKATFRLVRKAVTVTGVDLPPGAVVMIATAAANRDPRKFDDPAAFRLGRRGAKEHVSFGRGIHTCPGAALTRTEARISLERILQRFDRIAIDADHHGPEGDRRYSYVPSYGLRALSELHLRLRPSPQAALAA